MLAALIVFIASILFLFLFIFSKLPELKEKNNFSISAKEVLNDFSQASGPKSWEGAFFRLLDFVQKIIRNKKRQSNEFVLKMKHYSRERGKEKTSNTGYWRELSKFSVKRKKPEKTSDSKDNEPR